jgi:hypothetical protein
MAKIIELTGSPKNSGFSTKAKFLEALAQFGYEHGKMSKKNNKCDVLCTDDISSATNKMSLAKELNIEILTYTDLIELFDLKGDLD